MDASQSEEYFRSDVNEGDFQRTTDAANNIPCFIDCSDRTLTSVLSCHRMQTKTETSESFLQYIIFLLQCSLSAAMIPLNPSASSFPINRLLLSKGRRGSRKPGINEREPE